MDDLISRVAAIEICKSNVPNTNPEFYNLRSKAGYGSWMHSNGEAVASTSIWVGIEELPAVDAVPVIRCRDCCFGVLTKNSSDEDIVICENPDSPAVEQISIMPDWFCADGERRESE